MGVNRNISSWTASALFAAFIVLPPVAASADEAAPAALDPIEAPGDPSITPALASPRPAAGATPPLTRAAAKRRVDDMSPMTWLAGFGQVVVGRTAAPTDEAR
ncbi:MAG: hypothetical protein AAGC67_12950 [Myxococcota bacterium]